jgi:hypothetical protein
MSNAPHHQVSTDEESIGIRTGIRIVARDDPHVFASLRPIVDWWSPVYADIVPGLLCETAVRTECRVEANPRIQSNFVAFTSRQSV